MKKGFDPKNFEYEFYNEQNSTRSGAVLFVFGIFACKLSLNRFMRFVKTIKRFQTLSVTRASA